MRPLNSFLQPPEFHTHTEVPLYSQPPLSVSEKQSMMTADSCRIQGLNLNPCHSSPRLPAGSRPDGRAREGANLGSGLRPKSHASKERQLPTLCSEESRSASMTRSTRQSSQFWFSKPLRDGFNHHVSQAVGHDFMVIISRFPEGM